MSRIPNLKELVLRDTPFAELMTRRIYNVLLIATKYDAFMLEEDGRVDEQIFNEYNQLGLRYPPRFTQVTSEQEALAALSARHFELIIMMPNLDERDIFASARSIKQCHPETTIVVLAPFSSEVTRRFEGEDLSGIDYVFSWLGNAELLLAIVKLIEDKWNVRPDMRAAGVQSILLIEDSVRFYSAALPHLFRFVLKQSQIFAEEALNDQLRTMRMRGRPKILLARSYEEAMEIFDEFGENVLGVISDMSFMREGEKDPLAGLRFCRHVKARDRHIPLILNSSEEENNRYAAEVGASFVYKHSKTFAQDLHAEINRHFGFGDFVIIDPESRKPFLRVRSLHDLQAAIWKIPEQSLRYHLSHNHFSRFFFSRAMFPPAVILKQVDVDDYNSAQEARQFIFDLIVSYRHMKNDGVVAIYQRGRFDEYASFARIGRGSLGGKGRGLAFMSAMVRRYPKLETENFTVNIPKTVVLCTDIFDEFMEKNDLYPLALSNASDEEILKGFEEAILPEHLLEDLSSLLDVVHGPIAIRSSSLLEDAHYQPFAGVYSTYMVPPSEERIEMLRRLKGAIKAVYASVFYRASKTYLSATQNLIDQEKMAVVLQEVVGEGHNGRFYPTLSGVGRSLNCYPIAPEKAEDGVASVALGLGKHIVDGGRSLRFSPRHTQHILQLSDLKLTLSETQTSFAALDLENTVESFNVSENFNVLQCTLRDAEADGTLHAVCSTYDANDSVLRPGFQQLGRKIVTFQRLLQYGQFPLAKTIDRLLQIGRKEIGRHVEIEFALQLSGQKAAFYLLQIRPVVDEKFDVKENHSAMMSGRKLLLKSEKVLGNGIMTDVSHVLYVRPESFSAAENAATARDVSELNARFGNQAGYLLVGPGRWGSSDPWLGIPVRWTDVSAARVIVECGREDYRVDPSQGTHFFQNLTSLGVGYFTINPACGDGSFDVETLDALPAEAETPRVRLVRLPRPLTILMDGRHGKGEIRL